jgi:NADP-dependent 3-hydroxy acid dehydrogenase YdfG
MVHIAVQENDEAGSPAAWGEHVTDEQYMNDLSHEPDDHPFPRGELPMSTDSPTRRVAVITGASSGIGAATGRALAAAGYRVALLARRADRIQALAEELGDSALAIDADVTDRDSLVAAAQRVQDELGGTDVLVNNAGVMLLGPFISDQHAEQRQQVEVNLLGAMSATEVFLDQVRDGGGDLVNIASVAGRVAGPGAAAYHATKWALNGWSEALRQELQPDIRVIVVEPGAVATELAGHITHEETRKGTEDFVASTSIRSEDIADVIAFAVTRPQSVSLSEILVRPTAQAM